MTSASAHEVLELTELRLQRGGTLAPARLAYRTYGTLAPDCDNAILFPHWFAGTHEANEWLIGPGAALDTDRWFVVVPNMFGNGLSSSPSNTADWPGEVTIRDNVAAQGVLLTALGIRRLELVLGCSMGALQTYAWAALHPAQVRRALAWCGAPRPAPHGRVFIDGVRRSLAAGSATFSRVYAGWGLSQAFYWQERWRELGFESLEQFMADFWEGNFAGWPADDLRAMLFSWEHADVSDAELEAITAPMLALPSEKDLYFPPEDEVAHHARVARSEVRVIPGVYGHLAAGGLDPEASAVIESAIRELLGTDPDAVTDVR